MPSGSVPEAWSSHKRRPNPSTRFGRLCFLGGGGRLRSGTGTGCSGEFFPFFHTLCDWKKKKDKSGYGAQRQRERAGRVLPHFRPPLFSPKSRSFLRRLLHRLDGIFPGLVQKWRVLSRLLAVGYVGTTEWRLYWHKSGGVVQNSRARPKQRALGGGFRNRLVCQRARQEPARRPYGAHTACPTERIYTR